MTEFFFSPSDRRTEDNPIAFEIENITDIYQLVHAVLGIGEETFAFFYDQDVVNARWRKVAYFEYKNKALTRTDYNYPNTLPKPSDNNWRGFAFSYNLNPVSGNPCYEQYKYNQESNLIINHGDPQGFCLYQSNFNQDIDGTPLKEKVFEPEETAIGVEVKVTHCTAQNSNCNLDSASTTRKVELQSLHVDLPPGDDASFELLSLIPIGASCASSGDAGATDKSTRQIWAGGWLRYGTVKLLEIPKTDPIQCSITLRKSVGIITINHGQRWVNGRRKWCKKTMFAVSDNLEDKVTQVQKQIFLMDEAVTPAIERDDWQDWMYAWDVKDPSSKDACANLYTREEQYKEVNLKLDKAKSIRIDLTQNIESTEFKKYILAAATSEPFNAEIEVRTMTRDGTQCTVPQDADLKIEGKIYGFSFTPQQVEKAQILAASPDYRRI